MSEIGSGDAAHALASDQPAEIYGHPQRPKRVSVPGRCKIAVVQMTCDHDKDENLEQAVELVEYARQKQAQMVFFPEAFDYVGRNKLESIQLAGTMDDPIIGRFKELAVQHDIWISLGGFHERQEEIKEDGLPWITNNHILINPQGKIVNVYRKMHLFDVNIPNQNIHMHESGFVKPGDKLVVTGETPIGRIGLGICYDLRFPEFSMALREMGADVLTFPSAFTKHTGEAHWEALVKARAIENQCFVIAAAQSGVHTFDRISYGHSMVVDPWGTVLLEMKGGAGVNIAEIDLTHMEKVRREMPVMSHKIPELQRLSMSNIYTIPSEASGHLKFPFGHVFVKNEGTFLETIHCRAFVNRKCVVPGHVLVSTKRVVKRIQSLTPVEISDLFLLVQKTEMIMESIHHANSSTIAVQDGKDAGQTVNHVHVHVLPRKSKDFPENDTVYEELATHDKGENVKWRTDPEMKEECDLIRNHIKKHFPELLRLDRNSESELSC